MPFDSISFRHETKPAPTPSQKQRPRKPTLKAQIKAAQEAVAAVEDKLSEALTSTRADQMKALTAIYTVARELEAKPKAKAEFLEQFDISVHGHVRNPHQPVVKAFTKSSHQVMRSRTTKFAGAIGLAIAAGVEPGDFAKHIEDEGGIEEASKAYSKLTRPTVEERYEAARERLALMRKYLGDKPKLDCQSKAVEGYSGQQVAIIECGVDGSFGLYRVVELDQDQVDSFLVRHAKKAKEERS